MRILKRLATCLAQEVNHAEGYFFCYIFRLFTLDLLVNTHGTFKDV